MSEAIITGDKTAIKVEEYKGVYSLVAQNVSNDKCYAVWAKFKKNKDDYFDKDWPVKVTLGLKPGALEVLKAIYKEINGTAPVEKKPEPPPPPPPNIGNDDVPF